MKKSVKKILSVIAAISVLSSMTAITASAAGSEPSTVYQVCVEDNQHTENGMYVHEYVWRDPSSTDISVASALDDATWKTTKLDNGTVIRHRAAKEYNATHSEWSAHAETTAYKNGGGILHQTTARVVNAIFTSDIVKESRSKWAYAHTEAETDEVLASEPLLALRSYWSTQG